MADRVTEAAGISSAAAKAKTGKSLDEWFALLDKAGAAKWPHKDIAAHLHDDCGCPSWWCQMIAVGYEQARGLRVKNQGCGGDFVANASKTIAVPVTSLYKSWNAPDSMARWLPDAAKMTIRKATANKSMRITWIDGQSSVEVYFWIKGEAKSQVAVQHSKLESSEDVARWKAYWAEALLKLQALLEGTTVPGEARSVSRSAGLGRTKSKSSTKKRRTS
jgi:uncharacterized protein YndB with AHSA1/START domain